jgi:hypothetical protein
VNFDNQNWEWFGLPCFNNKSASPSANLLFNVFFIALQLFMGQSHNAFHAIEGSSNKHF